jgi:hypothetical protein
MGRKRQARAGRLCPSRAPWLAPNRPQPHPTAPLPSLTPPHTPSPPPRTPPFQVAEYMGGAAFRPPVHAAHDAPWERRDLLGVHPQKQVGARVCCSCACVRACVCVCLGSEGRPGFARELFRASPRRRRPSTTLTALNPPNPEKLSPKPYPPPKTGRPVLGGRQRAVRPPAGWRPKGDGAHSGALRRWHGAGAAFACVSVCLRLCLLLCLCLCLCLCLRGQGWAHARAPAHTHRPSLVNSHKRARPPTTPPPPTRPPKGPPHVRGERPVRQRARGLSAGDAGGALLHKVQGQSRCAGGGVLGSTNRGRSRRLWRLAQGLGGSSGVLEV